MGKSVQLVVCSVSSVQTAITKKNLRTLNSLLLHSIRLLLPLGLSWPRPLRNDDRRDAAVEAQRFLPRADTDLNPVTNENLDNELSGLRGGSHRLRPLPQKGDTEFNFTGRCFCFVDCHSFHLFLVFLDPLSLYDIQPLECGR